MRWLPPALLAIGILTGSTVDAGPSGDPRRMSVSLRGGGFDEQGSGGMLRRDDAALNPRVGWKASEQTAVGFGYELRPGLTIDGSFVRVEFDVGTDLLDLETSTQIATGDIEELRVAFWFDDRLFKGDATYFMSPGDRSKRRVAVGIITAFAEADRANVTEEAQELLGVAGVELGSQTSAGFGMRLDYALGKSGVTIGAEMAWLFAFDGGLLTVTTEPDAVYDGTVVDHEGLTFLADLSYRF